MATLPTLSLPLCHESALVRIINGRKRYVSCSECSAIMGANWANPKNAPSTAALNTLYNAGSHTANGGRTTPQIVAAVSKVYSHAPKLFATFDAAISALRSDYVLTVAGNYHMLPSNLQRWDRPFAGSVDAWHDVCAGPIAANDTSDDPLVWWRDPLAHGSKLYPWLYAFRGEWVNWSTVVAFANGMDGAKGITGYPKNVW